LSVSVFDHPWLSTLLGEDEIAYSFRPEAELSAMMMVEMTLTRVQTKLGIISAEAGAAIAATMLSFQPDKAGLKRGCSRASSQNTDTIA
jgi:3-carboxy-cis,cis-muconate cycloisomerase